MTSNDSPSGGNAPRARPSIVYVDDDSDLLKLVELCFKIFGGTEIATYSDGEKFQQMFEKGAYGILLFDWQMPRLTGIDLADWVRNVQGDSDATVILVTARNVDEESEMIKRLHISGVIPKPFDPHDFATMALALHRKG
ncbi:MAG: response regulator [Rhodobacteraceae bacterium]|jgi:DNA-binding response OmpR family regulator|nr:response regulator [Paracoccaceae bacterium]